MTPLPAMEGAERRAVDGPSPTVLRASGAGRLALLVATGVACGLLGVLSWMNHQTDRQADQATERLLRAQAIATDIVRLDERLTQSVRLAAATGEAQWIDRYESDLAGLDARLDEAARLAEDPEAQRQRALAGQANDRLVALEREALARVRQGDGTGARRLLDSPHYAQAKTALDAGTRRYLDALASLARADRERVLRESGRRMAAAYAVAVLSLLALWGWLRRQLLASDAAFRRHHAAADAARRADRAKADILEGADVGTWEWSVPDDDWRLNARGARLIGWELARLHPLTRSKWLALAHPEDRASAEAAMHEHLAGASSHYTAEVRVRHWDGQWIWLLDRGRVSERDARGRPLRVAGTLTDITELADARALWQARAELSGDWFWQTDAHHRLSYVAAGAGGAEALDERGLLGRRRDEVASYGPPDGGWEAFHHELDRHEALRGVALRVDAATAAQVRWIELDGRPRFSHDGLFIGYEGVGRDITDRRRDSARLRESASLVDALFQALPVPVLMQDALGRPLRANRAWDALAVPQGDTTDDPPGGGRGPLPLPELRSADVLETEDHRLMRQGGSVQRETRIRRPDGRPMDVLLGKAAITDGEGRPLGLVSMLVDIGEQKAASRQLLEAKDAAESASRAKSAFLATMSHEIRTPMNGVIGMAELMLQAKGLDTDQRSTVQTIHDSARSLLALLDDVLDFSKIEAGRLELERTAIELTPLVEGLCDAQAAVAAARDVRLQAFVQVGQGDRVLGDPTRLRQVLANLVSNAIKFSAGRPGRPGEVTLRVRCAPAPDGADGGTAPLEFEVADNGIGMDGPTLERLFTPFTQAEVSTTRRFGGTGLGLAICRRLVDLMGGSISVRSAPGEGSAFRVVLPLPRADEPGAPDDGPRLDGLSCVLVESAGLPAEDLGAWLRTAGARVHASAGLDDAEALALALLAAGTVTQPVLVVSDDRLALAPGAVDPRLRHLRVGRGRRAVARPVAAGVVHLDVLRRRAFQEAVALLSGRLAMAPAGPRGGDLLLDPRVAPPSVAEAQERGQLVLVAEDDATNRSVIRRQLALLGYACELAEDGEAALRLWSTRRHALLLTDLHMPGLDGYGLAQAIRRDEAALGRTRLPIVALTANALKGEAARARASGFDDYLTKPVPLQQLQASLNHWMPAPRRAGDDAPPGDWLAFLPDPVPRDAGAATLPMDLPALPRLPQPLEDPSDGGPVTDFTALLAPAGPDDRRGDTVLDLQVLRELVGDDEATLRDLLGDFLAAARVQADDLREAYRRGDPSLAAASAHKLKSASRSVGALALGEICAAIERARVPEDPARARRRIEWFDTAFRAVCERIDPILKGPRP